MIGGGTAVLSWTRLFM